MRTLAETGRPDPDYKLNCYPAKMGAALIVGMIRCAKALRLARAAADRAFAFVEKGPLRDWNWEGQFEDVRPCGKYVNLSKHVACDAALYLLRRWPKDAGRIAEAREILRFSEDQFVIWEVPDTGACACRRGTDAFRRCGIPLNPKISSRTG